MDDGALSALKAAFDVATSWNEWSTAVVVFGVAIEFLALLIFSKEMSRAEKLMLVIGSLLVVGGVGGEYIFGSRATRIATELQQYSDQAVAGLKAQQEADHKIATQAAAHAADLGVSYTSFFRSTTRSPNYLVAIHYRNTIARPIHPSVRAPPSSTITSCRTRNFPKMEDRGVAANAGTRTQWPGA